MACQVSNLTWDCGGGVEKKVIVEGEGKKEDRQGRAGPAKGKTLAIESTKGYQKTEGKDLLNIPLSKRRRGKRKQTQSYGHTLQQRRRDQPERRE